LIWVFVFPNELYAESEWYFEQANNLKNGLGYIRNGEPSAMWPVGYPLFLSLIYRITPPTAMAAKLANVILLTLDVVLIFGFAWLIVPKHPQALILAAIVTFYPTHIMASSLLATESLYSVLVHLLLLVILIATYRSSVLWWIIAAALAGVITMVRTEGGVLLLLVMMCYIATLYTRDKRFRKLQSIWGVALMVTIFCAIIAPWTIRNWRQIGLFIPVSSTGCMNIWIGNGPDADGGFNWNGNPSVNPAALRPDDTEATWYLRTCDAAIDAVLDDPIRAISLWPRKYLKLWEDDYAIVHWNISGTDHRFGTPEEARLRHTANLYYWLVLILSLIGLVTRTFRRLYGTNGERRQSWTFGYLLSLAYERRKASVMDVWLPAFSCDCPSALVGLHAVLQWNPFSLRHCSNFCPLWR
jgi:hypothetical protein